MPDNKKQTNEHEHPYYHRSGEGRVGTCQWTEEQCQRRLLSRQMTTHLRLRLRLRHLVNNSNNSNNSNNHR